MTRKIKFGSIISVILVLAGLYFYRQEQHQHTLVGKMEGYVSNNSSIRDLTWIVQDSFPLGSSVKNAIQTLQKEKFEIRYKTGSIQAQYSKGNFACTSFFYVDIKYNTNSPKQEIISESGSYSWACL